MLKKHLQDRYLTCFLKITFMIYISYMFLKNNISDIHPLHVSLIKNSFQYISWNEFL